MIESMPVAHFDTVCRFVTQTYSDMFTQREQNWLSSLASLDDPAKILYVRLLNRRFNAFRLSKLSYAEVEDMPAATAALAKASLASTDAPGTVNEIIRLFTKQELVTLYNRPDLKNLTKPEIVDELMQSDADAFVQRLQNADRWLCINGHDVYSWFLLCFFGNRHQDMTEFVLRELGSVSYYPYKIDKSTRAFENRQQIDSHLSYYECSVQYEQLNKKDAEQLLSLDQSLPSYRAHDTVLARRVDRLRITLARQLERIGERSSALELYRQCNRAPARERMVRIHQHLKNYQTAWTLMNQMSQQPYCDEELQFVDIIKPKLARQMGRKTDKAQSFKPASSKLVLRQDANLRVESMAQRFYSENGKCYYSENTLFNGVLGLLIWDEIFAEVPGAFFNPFQYAPADFYDPSFVQRRQASLQRRLNEINQGSFKRAILTRYQQCHGYANPLVRWDYLGNDLLEQALEVIPAAHWHAVFQRQLNDLRHNTSGFPDLVFFNNDGSYELIEVKGPGDAVQKNQKRWFAYFQSMGVPYRVVHVRWASQPVAG